MKLEETFSKAANAVARATGRPITFLFCCVLVLAWAFAGDCDPAALTSIPCQIEWPPRSGRVLEFPEIDRGDWFSFALAHQKLLSAQTIFLERLAAALPA